MGAPGHCCGRDAARSEDRACRDHCIRRFFRCSMNKPLTLVGALLAPLPSGEADVALHRGVGHSLLPGTREWTRAPVGPLRTGVSSLSARERTRDMTMLFLSVLSARPLLCLALLLRLCIYQARICTMDGTMNDEQQLFLESVRGTDEGRMRPRHRQSFQHQCRWRQASSLLPRSRRPGLHARSALSWHLSQAMIERDESADAADIGTRSVYAYAQNTGCGERKKEG
jgi:hypothetical protein